MVTYIFNQTFTGTCHYTTKNYKVAIWLRLIGNYAHHRPYYIYGGVMGSSPMPVAYYNFGEVNHIIENVAETP
jgi:hypothetical protein